MCIYRLLYLCKIEPQREREHDNTEKNIYFKFTLPCLCMESKKIDDFNSVMEGLEYVFYVRST